MTSKNHCIPRLRTLPADDPTGQDSCRQAVILIVANHDLTFNNKTLRFLLTYPIGYVNVGIAGVEGDDTPNMTIGKCSPL